MSTISLQQVFEVALTHHRAGRLADAELLYRKILHIEPAQPDSLYNLGLILRHKSEISAALELWDRAAKVAPQRADVHSQIAWALLDMNEPYRSAAAARKALQIQPQFPEAQATLARALAAVHKFDEAIESARRAVELRPRAPELHTHYGQVLQMAGRFDDAQRAFLRAIELDPKNPIYHRNLAAVCDAMNDVDGALAAAEEALRLGREDAQLLTNISTLHRRRCDHAAARDFAERALALDSSLAAAHGALAIALLALGEYERGFHEYEWRWRCDNFTTAARDFGRPMWDGSDPSGRTIFVHTEQGFGDTIQFARYVPLLARRGATVLLECHASLRTLLRRLDGVAKIIPAGMRPPEFDLHTPLLSLPKWMGTTFDSVPNHVPYLTPDPQRVAVWQSRIDAPGVKVGLVWSGNLLPDPNRTCPLPNFAPLREVPRVTFYSLQVGDAARETAASSNPLPIIDLSAHLSDFDDTAAAMHCLDLIITIDTAAAHLAGALGRPVWTLLPWSPDWRWLPQRPESVWYPTMLLFHQRLKGDWSEPLAAVAQRLLRMKS